MSGQDNQDSVDYQRIVKENKNLLIQIKEKEKLEQINNEKINENSNKICNFEKQQLDLFTQEIRKLETQENTTRQRVEESLLELREFYSNHVQTLRQRQSQEANIQQMQHPSAQHHQQLPPPMYHQQQNIIDQELLKQQIINEIRTINDLMTYHQQLRADAISQQQEQDETNQLLADMRELLRANSQDLHQQREQNDFLEDSENIMLTN